MIWEPQGLGSQDTGSFQTCFEGSCATSSRSPQQSVQSPLFSSSSRSLFFQASGIALVGWCWGLGHMALGLWLQGGFPLSTHLSWYSACFRLAAAIS